MGGTDPFHPKWVKFQPLPMLLNPLWLGMQQSALSTDRLHLQNWGLQATAPYLALKSESTELHQDPWWKEGIISANTQADCAGVAVAVAVHSTHHHWAVMARVGGGVAVVLAGFSSGSGLLQSASLCWDGGFEMSVDW